MQNKKIPIQRYFSFATIILTPLPVFIVTGISHVGYAQSKSNTDTQKKTSVFTAFPTDDSNGVEGLRHIAAYLKNYRNHNKGKYPAQMASLIEDINRNPDHYGVKKFKDIKGTLINPDTKYSDDPSERQLPNNSVPYFISNTRMDGSPVGSPKLVGTLDALSWLNIYYHNSNRVDGFMNPVGFYLVLWDNDEIHKIPYDIILFLEREKMYERVFPSQAGKSNTLVRYEEYWADVSRLPVVPIGKPIPTDREEPITDNGGPEALVTLSRRLSYPNQYGIDREELWKQFDAAQEQFSLDEVLAGAAGLNLPLQKRALSLDELQKLGAPAIFEDKERARLATLTALDADMAIVQDEGRTRIVARETLAKRYGGNALVKDSAPSALQIDDAIRALTFKSKDETKEQIVTLANTGAKPLHLQIERPIPGVSEASLDKDELAPGQSAQLKLQIRWRDVLKGDTQNVFVTIKSDDAARPRAMLGFKLSLTKTP